VQVIGLVLLAAFAIGSRDASGFLFSALLSLATFLARRKRGTALFRASAPRLLLPVLVVVVGTANAVANLVALGLIGRLAGIVVLPVMNGGSVLATSVASMVICREGASAPSLLALAAGIAVPVLLCLR
jgi:hypothetical protein